MEKLQEFSAVLQKILKERNKIVFMANIIGAVLDLNLNNTSSVVIYLILKQMKQISGALISKLNNMYDSFDPSISSEQWKAFFKSQDMKIIKEYIENENASLAQNLTLFGESIKKDYMLTHDKELESFFSMDSQYFYLDDYKKFLAKYGSTVKQFACDTYPSDGEMKKKLLIHACNILDARDINWFFSNSINQEVA